jgi:hypothetical protein
VKGLLLLLLGLVDDFFLLPLPPLPLPLELPDLLPPVRKFDNVLPFEELPFKELPLGSSLIVLESKGLDEGALSSGIAVTALMATEAEASKHRI